MKFPNCARAANEKPIRFTNFAAALVLTAGLGVPACADHVPVPTELTSCPCTGGAVCCSSGICAANQNACTAATQALSESVQGVWTGYLENFQTSSDDSIKISIDVAPDGTLSGAVTVGQETPPAPATDPNVPWPPSISAEMPLRPFSLPSYIPGFAYQARNIRWESRRLRFDIAQNEAWQPWCALQQSYPDSPSPGTFNCVPGNGALGQFDANGNQTCLAEQDGNVIGPVECFKVFVFCGITGPCACNSSGCAAKTDSVYSFDIAMRDGVGDGSNSLSNGNIRLTQSSR